MARDLREDCIFSLRGPVGGFDLGPWLLGPAPVEGTEEVRAVVRVPRTLGTALSDALGEMQRLRSARKLDAVRVQVDPVAL